MRQVSPEHYDFLAYNNQRRFGSYFKQIALVIESGARSVLEVGKGDGFMRRNLPDASVRVTTIDYEEMLKPDAVADIRSLPFSSGQFDAVCAFQVLEHLPWEHVTGAVTEIKRCASSTVLLSVPDSGPYLQAQMRLPLLGTRRLFVELGRLWKRTHRFDGQHYWEVGTVGHSPAEVERQLECHEWAAYENERLFANPYHRFFTLKRRRVHGPGSVGRSDRCNAAVLSRAKAC